MSSAPAIRPATAPASAATPDALGLLTALRRRWALALSLGILAAAVVGPAVWLLIPASEYTATTTLQVHTYSRPIMFPTQERAADYGTYQKTQVALIKDAIVLTKAIEKVKGLKTLTEQEDARKWLADEIRAEFVGGSEVLKISLSGGRPDDLTKIVNAIRESYLVIADELEKGDRAFRLKKLEGLWQKYQEDLKIQRSRYRNLVEQAGTSDEATIAIAQQGQAENLVQIQRQRLEAQTQLLRAEAELATLQEAAERIRFGRRPVSEAAIAAQVEQSRDVAELRDSAAALYNRYHGIARLTRNPGNDPALAMVRKEYRNVLSQLEQARSRERAALAERAHKDQQDDLAASLAKAQEQVNLYKNLRVKMDQEIEGIETVRKKVSGEVVDLEAEREELAVLDGIAQDVRKEVESLRIEMGAPKRIKTISEAWAPTAQDGSKQVRMSAIAALGALACTVLGISYWEFRARKIDSAEQVSASLGLRLVGALPALPDRGRSPAGEPGTALDRRWQNLLIESIDATRTMLLHASRREAVRVVMVTSAVKSEGKTSLACHLATSLARAGRSTLLVDCDLRRPSCHRLFDLPAGPGVCELLRGEADLDAAVQPTPAAYLSVIPAGVTDEAAIQALARDEMSDLFAVLKGRYDFVIVDSAPVLPVADGLLISQHVDAVVFSILRNVSRLPLIQAAYDRLACLGIKMLGAVIAGVPSDPYGYGVNATAQAADA